MRLGSSLDGWAEPLLSPSQLPLTLSQAMLEEASSSLFQTYPEASLSFL